MAWLLVSALILDALLGELQILWRHLGHPVAWMAWLLLRGEDFLNKPDKNPGIRRFYGTLWFAFCLLFSVGIALLITHIASNILTDPWDDIITILIASIFLAYHSLLDHVGAVEKALLSGNLEGARKAVARIVGRDTHRLNPDGISRAAIESLAENFSDGVIAPAFWFLLGGLPGLVAYKLTNTADSIIGHRTERFQDFGWAAARFDDLLNFIPARITTLLLGLGGLFSGKGDIRRGLSVGSQYSPYHASPNAGWPEATMAGLLDIKLGGPRHYTDGKHKDNAWLGNGREAKVTDLDSAMTISRYAWLATCILLILGGLLWT